MVISDFTKLELDFYRECCNFVGSERELFELRSRGVTLEAIAENLNLSTDGAKRISRKVNNKIRRVQTHF